MLDLHHPIEACSRNTLSPEERKKQLYLAQKDTLDQFLARGAISPAQYKKSLQDLTVKMDMQDVLNNG